MEVFLLFVIYSFFGCVLEDAYNFALTGRYMSKRMLLTLPVCPVYGLAGIMLAALNRSSDPAVLFANGFLTVGALELAYYLTSVKLYGVKWWDYSEHKFNIMGGVCLKYSVLWGLINIVFALWVHPFFAAWVNGLPPMTKMLAGTFLFVYMLADVRETRAELIKYKNGEKNRVTERFLYIKTNN